MSYSQYGPPGYGGQPSYGYDNRQSGYMGAPQFQPANNAPDFAATRNGGGRDAYNYGGEGRNARYEGRGPRAGLGADSTRNVERDRQHIRDSMAAQQPPTREEVARTIFVGGLGESAPPDEALEAILGSAGKLRRWMRAKDANDKKCRFGFAEFEDVDSLEAAKEVFGGGIDVPVYKDGKMVMQEDDDSKPEMMQLPVIIDKQSSSYIEEWMSKRRETADARLFRIEGAKEDLRQCIFGLRNGNAFAMNANAYGANGMIDVDGDMMMQSQDGIDGIALDDDLADIPPEMRVTVAKEIKNFRDRSNLRDAARQREEEAYEAAHRPVHRAASPPATNGRGPAGAPSGPKGYRGVQLPSDYVNGVNFTNGNFPPEDESDASDTELENRRQASKAEQQDKQFIEAERRWLNRERQREAALEREKVREEAEQRDRNRQKEMMARRFSNWNDDEEQKYGRDEYYHDRSAWARRRAAVRDREARDDDRDRNMEQREVEAERQRHEDSRNAADRFLAEAGAEIAAAAAKQGPAGAFKISLAGGARNKMGESSKKTMADVAGLLEEEEDAAESGQQRGPRAIPDVAVGANAGADMTEEERDAARKDLAADIPLDAASLFAWDVRWSYIRPELLEKDIRPFVERKVVEYLGIQEDYLVDRIMSDLKAHKSAEELMEYLEKVLEDDAESFVKKVWRLVVYFAEAEGRGLNS